ncbi:uncharacterized protein CDAR_449411 [Caerostris darwini]|uniref:Transposase IS30-like HTH domain-containing protein n=1 Tax=Caerostris darwini TaxID=1538125 RepID=A0AAV4QT38_9ARAC|nr:uncharacterized protein CDAR_449411 [Caerostris darwini]
MDLKGKEITPEERKIIIKLRNEGKTLREIGKIVGRTHSSIQRVINNYTSSKSIISKPRSGRPSKLTAREKRYVFKSVRLNPQHVRHTVERVAARIILRYSRVCKFLDWVLGILYHIRTSQLDIAFRRIGFVATSYYRKPYRTRGFLYSSVR